jgi:hypothetical protein
MNLIKILNNAMSKPDILLSEKDKKNLKERLLKNPLFFIIIGDNINKIIKDGKISPHEIPEIISIITDINNIDIVRFIIQSILSSIIIPEKDLFMMNKVIQSSIKLLETNTKKRFFCF